MYLRINKGAYFFNKQCHIRMCEVLRMLLYCNARACSVSLLLHDYPQIVDSLEYEIMNELFSLPTINDNYQDNICVAFINEKCFHKLQHY